MADNFNSWLFSREDVENFPSRKDGITWENEKYLRSNSCEFILELGIYLRDPNKGVEDTKAAIRESSACVLFHRFFTAQSFKSHNRLIVGTACLFLAGKIEGCFRYLSDILKIYFKVRGLRTPSEAEFQDHQEMVLVAERIILHTLCFDMQIEHPIKPVSQLLSHLKIYIPKEKQIEVLNVALSFLRDSLGTVLCLLYPASSRAAGALFLATLQLDIPPQMQPQQHKRLSAGGPSPQKQLLTSSGEEVGKSWYELFKSSIQEVDLKNICYQMIEVYEPSRKWKTKSEAKTVVQSGNLKSHLSHFFQSAQPGQTSLNLLGNRCDSEDNCLLRSSYSSRDGISDQITLTSKNVEKIEKFVEKNKNIQNNNMNVDITSDDKEEVNLDDPYPYGDYESPLSLNNNTPPGARVPMLVQQNESRTVVRRNVTTLVSHGMLSTAPPPTPDNIPPPPLPPPPMQMMRIMSPQASASLSHPTPEYISPPPSTSNSHSLVSQPTPDFLPPPPTPSFSPPTQHMLVAGVGVNQPTGVIHNDHTSRKTSGMDDLINGLLQQHSEKSGSSSVMRNKSQAVIAAVVNGTVMGRRDHSKLSTSSNGNGFGNGYRNGLSSPPSYCSPPESNHLESDHSSSKRARLLYDTDDRLAL